LGFSNLFASACVALYYNVIIAWTIYYAAVSLTSKLPWEDCEGSHNSDCDKEYSPLFHAQSLLVCFSINDFKDCEDERKDGGVFSVYHLGRCLNEDEHL